MLWIYFFGARHELRETSVGRIMRCVNSSCASESMMRVSKMCIRDRFAAHYKLDNLVCLVDNNGRQLDGAVADVMSHGKGIGAKFDAFGWNVIDVADGNDVEQILGALEQAKACKGKPTCLILNTVKGKGATLSLIHI